MERAEVVRKARDAGVHLVSFFWCDNGGIIRGKSTHISGLEGRLSSGIGVAYAMLAMGDMAQLQPVAGMGPAGVF
ncbi:MAG: glutamine synthetase, partial [Chloroflexi bacterium]|nr:glutamine synthetase [Chloroflexota bacterium]